MTADKKLYSSVTRASIPEIVPIFQSLKYILYEKEDGYPPPIGAKAL